MHLPRLVKKYFSRLHRQGFPLPVALVFPIVVSSVLASDDISQVPSWAKDAVWYQIFPERFRNGDPQNDPKPDDIAGSWPHERAENWQVSPWTSDWYALQPWEEAGGRGFYYRVQQRRYGGDLQGVIDKLGYLKELGVTAIYFNPLFESPSLHKYDATMYHHIDNNFGPDPEGDRRIWETEDPANPETWRWTSADKLFLQLVERAHTNGMHVIIDGVFNHVGMTFWAFKDVQANGEDSRFKNWFVVERLDDPLTPENEFSYQGWNGVRELPEVREDESGLVEGPREHVHAIVRRWMDPNGDGNPGDGIDGWRLDVAEKVAIPFWVEFRKWVRAINPEAYIVGEVWWEDWDNGKMFNATPWLKGDAFDAVMNYRWAREVDHFFKDRENKITASEFDRRLNRLRNDYRPDVNYVLMNLMDSHDTDRLASQIVNVDASYDKRVGLSDNPAYDPRKPTADEIRILKLIVLYQMTGLGAPMVYYGGEAGMWGGDDPDERKPMLWPDMQFENEIHHPHGKQRPNDENEFNADLFSHYQALIKLRKASNALRRGDYQAVVCNDQQNVYAFQRMHDEEQVLVVINNSEESRDITLPTPAGAGEWKLLFGMDGPGLHSSMQGAGPQRITVASKSGAVLTPE